MPLCFCLCIQQLTRCGERKKILSQDSILHFCLRKGLNMNKPLTFSKLWAQMKKLFLPWLIVAVLAGIAVLGINLVSDRKSVV